MELCSTNSLQILLWPQGRAKQGGVTCSRSLSKTEANVPHGKGGNGTLPSPSPSQYNVRPPKGCCWLLPGLAAAESRVLMLTDILMG